MIERAIENWLTKTNERNYQVPFCQALATQGHRIVYISADRPLEQGKDVITVAPDSMPCAYQLKSGNIGQNRWRKEIRPEIVELIESLIRHPNIPKKKLHRAYLVLNGTISDEVRIAIDQLNEDNRIKRRKCAKLEVIQIDQLLEMFIDAQGRFVPKTLRQMKPFLELFVVDGRDFLDKELLSKFLQGTVFDKKPRQRSEAINAISGSVVLMGYALNEYQTCLNHFAIFEAWTVLGGAILKYASENKLRDAEWRTSFDLVMFEIRRALQSLFEEAEKRKDFIEGSHIGDGGLMYKMRVTLIIGACAALALDKHERDANGCIDKNIVDFVGKNIMAGWFWGESAVAFYFCIVRLMEAGGHAKVAIRITKEMCKVLLLSNSPNNQSGLASPYYSPGEVLAATFGIEDAEIDFSSFVGSSHMIKPLVSMLARRNERAFVAEHWRKITRILHKEFTPRNSLDALSWRTGSGVNNSWFPEQTQSWRKLRQAAAVEAKSCLPLLVQNRAFARYHALVMPHRAVDSLLSFLDSEAAPPKIWKRRKKAREK